jgi:hypothetical protein
VARIAERALAAGPAREDVGLQLRDVPVGNLAGDHLAEPRLDQALKLACKRFPAFEPGPHLAVRLAHRRLHPCDVLIDDLIDGDAAQLDLPRLGLPRALRNVLAATDPVLQGHGLDARMLDGEQVAMIDADPDRAAHLRGGAGELQIEDRAFRGDADIQAADLRVVVFGLLGHAGLAEPVRDVLALAFCSGDNGHWLQLSVRGCWNRAGALSWAGLCKGHGLGLAPAAAVFR